MRSSLVVPALAALTSAFLFLSIGFGLAGMPLIAYFVQLPILFVGFAFGLMPASIASAGSAGLVLIAGGWAAGLTFVVVEAGPVLLVIRQALQNRQGTDGKLEWYPPGLILAQLAIYGLAVSAFVLATIWMVGPGIDVAFNEGIDAVATQLGATVGTAAVVEVVRAYSSYIPGIIALSGIFMVIVNSVLAQWLARKSDRALRPSPVFSDLWLPVWCMPALAAAMLLAFVAGGDLAYVADTALIVFAVPFLFLGLAVVHKIVAQLGARWLILGALYLSLVIFSWPLVLVLVGLGLLEERLHFRRRFA